MFYYFTFSAFCTLQKLKKIVIKSWIRRKSVTSKSILQQVKHLVHHQHHLRSELLLRAFHRQVLRLTRNDHSRCHLHSIEKLSQQHLHQDWYCLTPKNKVILFFWSEIPRRKCGVFQLIHLLSKKQVQYSNGWLKVKRTTRKTAKFNVVSHAVSLRHFIL